MIYDQSVHRGWSFEFLDVRRNCSGNCIYSVCFGDGIFHVVGIKFQIINFEFENLNVKFVRLGIVFWNNRVGMFTTELVKSQYQACFVHVCAHLSLNCMLYYQNTGPIRYNMLVHTTREKRICASHRSSYVSKAIILGSNIGDILTCTALWCCYFIAGVCRLRTGAPGWAPLLPTLRPIRHCCRPSACTLCHIGDPWSMQVEFSEQHTMTCNSYAMWVNSAQLCYSSLVSQIIGIWTVCYIACSGK